MAISISASERLSMAATNFNVSAVTINIEGSFKVNGSVLASLSATAEASRVSL
ncbi:MAG: hypothetical protein WCS90_01650 [Bacilli bacterium]